jgi:hypothetical protein
MNDNILYHALATRSILRAFGKIPRSSEIRRAPAGMFVARLFQQ